MAGMQEGSDSTRIQLKRAYERPAASDGQGMLVDALWPRVVKKDRLQLQEWLKGVAPSAGLRRWFHAQPDRWSDFQRRYQAELEAAPDAWQPVLEAARRGKVTLLYSAKDQQHNNAVVLRQFLQRKLEGELGAAGGAGRASKRARGTEAAQPKGEPATSKRQRQGREP